MKAKMKNIIIVFLYANIIVAFLCAIILIEGIFLIVADHNFEYNERVVALKDYGLDMCEEYIELTANTLHNYETYCPEVTKGLENGSLKLLVYNLEGS